MKLLVLSDLHLELSDFRPPTSSREADVVVLAGDIGKRDQGIHWARKNWSSHEIIYVAGNHEFYRSDINEAKDCIRKAASETGVHFLDDSQAIINIAGRAIRFLGSTLWTDFCLFGVDEQYNCMVDGEQSLNDFRLIQNGEWLFSAQDSINLHTESVRWLESKLTQEQFDGPTVVATHHAPSWSSVIPRYQKNTISACFASRLDHLLGFSKLWIHGHMHDSLDYVENNTRVVCNPRGYCRYDKAQENFDFNPGLIIEI